MTYFRIHTADIAYITQQPRGLFTAIGKLVDAKMLTEEETAEYWKNREYFEKILPVPPFYEQGNPDHATTWFKDTPQGKDIYRQMTFYRAMAKKYGLKLYMSKCQELPGQVIYEDDFQIAVKNQKADAPITVSELGKVEIKEFSQEEDKEYWLSKIKESDWRAAKFLVKLLETGDFYKHCGKSSKVFLLVDGPDLVSFCTYAEKDEIPDTELTPWIGFVYTFPQFRGKRRIGKLIEHIYRLAKSEGKKALYISTDQQGLYENFGCTFKEILKDGNGEDCLIYTLPIEGKDYSAVIGTIVKGKIDRPLGTRHPRHPEMVYPINYGYVSDVFAGDGAEQDVYVFGTDKPIYEYEGKVIAVYHRLNDCEDKWIVSLDGKNYSDQEILEKISFQEQYFMGELYR